MSASGEMLPNKGEKVVYEQAPDGQLMGTRYQIADVHRPLLAVSELCDSGNRVLFGRAGGYIFNPQTGLCRAFPRRGGIYELDQQIINGEPGGQTGPGFIRPGK